MNTEPLVSIIMPSYNASKFISKTIESLAAQIDAPPYELIICDDASIDDTLMIIQKYAEKYDWIKVIRQTENQGPVKARNKCLSLARGRFVAFLDADDLWRPNKLSRQIAFMEKNDCALSYTDYRHANENLTRIGCRIRPPKKIGYFGYLITRYIGCLTVVIDRDKVTDFRFEDLKPARRGEDYLAWGTVISKHGPALLCPGDLAIYRIVRNSRSYSKIKSSVSIWYLYRNHFKLSRYVSALAFISYTIFAFFKHVTRAPLFSMPKI